MEEEERIRFSIGRQHIDIVYRIVATDEASQTETLVIEADPHRYEWQEADGNWLLVDKFEPDMFPAEVFFKIISRIFHAPVYHEIKDTSYSEIKRKSLRIFITRERRKTS